MHTQNDFLQHSHNPGAVWRDRLLTAGAAIVIGLSLSNIAPADETKRENQTLRGRATRRDRQRGQGELQGGQGQVRQLAATTRTCA